MVSGEDYPQWNLAKDQAIAQSIRLARIPLCISDPNLPDNPIVFANAAFCELTGYGLDEIIGRNCRLLQGKGTTKASVDAIRSVINQQRVDTVEIVNYKKDGTAFVNALQVGPIMDDAGHLVYYFGSQLDVTAKLDLENQARELADEELLHRLRNIVNVMTVIIRMSAREERDTKALSSTIIERLTALSEAHFRTIGRPQDHSPSLGDLARTILKAYAPHGDRQFSLFGPDHALPTGLISSITLGLHELAANSVKHGALSVETGRVDLGWTLGTGPDGECIAFTWSEKNGPEVTKPERNSGSRIIASLTEATGGSMTFNWHNSGLVVEAAFPL